MRAHFASTRFTKWHFSHTDSLINKWIRFQTAIENRFLILSAVCPPVLRLSSFSLLWFLSLSLFIWAGECVLHLSAELGGSWTERMLGYVKVTRASCHPSLRFPLSSSIIEPLNQAPLHTGDVSERARGTPRSRLPFSFGYLLFHRPAELTTL